MLVTLRLIQFGSSVLVGTIDCRITSPFLMELSAEHHRHIFARTSEEVIEWNVFRTKILKETSD